MTIAALALAAAVAAPQTDARPAPLGVQDDRLTSGPVASVPARLRLLQRSGTRVTRVDVLWSLLAPRRPRRSADPADRAYDFARIDAVVRGLARRGIVPILVSTALPPGRPAAAGARATAR